PVTPARHRYAMAQLATQSNPAFEVSSLELNRPGASYTVDTLTQLQAQYPAARLYYLTGVDAIAEILTWKRHAELIRLATFIAATRPGFDPALLGECLPPAYRERIRLLETTALNISSTGIRDRIRQGLPARYLTPDSVLDYISQQGLYRERPELALDG